MVGRGELTDAAWERIAPQLPGVDGRGRPWRDHRQAINGVLRGCGRVLRGVTCRNASGHSRRSVYERFARWEVDGTWARLLEEVQVHDDPVVAMEWTDSIDSAINRAHQYAAGARNHSAHRPRGGRASCFSTTESLRSAHP
ncbi:transposase [Streptomyces sp. SAS_272]|uniref:transposase n=1 Tax=Streptomyces sp. SAS_272 TaxID=3412747 RepID=UPI00403C804A